MRDLLDLPTEAWAVLRAAELTLVIATIPMVLLAFVLPTALASIALFGIILYVSERPDFAARVVAVFGGAILMGAFVGTSIAATDSYARKSDVIVIVSNRLHSLALFYVLPVVAVLFIFDAGFFEGAGRDWLHDDALPAELVRRGGALLALLVVTCRVGLAPAEVVRGRGFLDALRSSSRGARGHEVLVVATTLIPGGMVLGGVLSFVSVVSLQSAGASSSLAEVGARGALIVLIGSIVLAPFVAGVLKVAALRIATRPRSDAA